MVVIKKYDLLCLRSVPCKTACANLFFFPSSSSPKGKDEPWHLLTCKDYVVLDLIDWLGSPLEMLLGYVLCFHRARALLIGTSPRSPRPHEDVGMLLCVCSCSLGGIFQHTVQHWLEHACHSQLTLMTLLPT